MRKKSTYFRGLILPVLCLITTQGATAQQPPQPQPGLRSAIETALTNNRSLQADSLNINIAAHKNTHLAGLYRPQVNYSSRTEYNPEIPKQMLPGSIAGQPGKDLVAVQFGTKYNMQGGIEVTQTIFRKDLLIQMRSAGLQNDIARTKYTLSKEELVYQVAAMYYSLQANAEMIRTTHFDFLNMKGILGIAEAQFKNGVLKKIDYEALQINVANTESHLNQLRTQYSEQLAYFNYLLGLPASTETAIAEIKESDLRVIESDKGPQREDIRLSGLLISAKEVEMKSIRAEKLPVTSSYFRYSYQSQFNSSSKAFNSDYLNSFSTVGVSMTMPILDGNRRKTKLRIASTELEQLKLKNERQVEQAQMELYTAKSSLENKHRDYLITTRNLELASKVFASRKALYTEGVTTLVELLDAERELSQARNQHIQALINVQSGRLDLYKANGNLLTDFLNTL